MTISEHGPGTALLSLSISSGNPVVAASAQLRLRGFPSAWYCPTPRRLRWKRGWPGPHEPPSHLPTRSAVSGDCIASVAGSVGRCLAWPGVPQPEPGGRRMPQGLPDEGVAGERSGGSGCFDGVSSIESRVRGQREVRHEKPLQQRSREGPVASRSSVSARVRSSAAAAGENAVPARPADAGFAEAAPFSSRSASPTPDSWLSRHPTLTAGPDGSLVGVRLGPAACRRHAAAIRYLSASEIKGEIW